MIWHQGESDAALAADEYQELLTSFTAAVRKELDLPKLPFGIGEVYDNGKRDSIRTAQKATAAAVPGAFLVTANELKTFDQGVHFDAASQIELGKRFAEGMIQATTMK